MATLIKNLQNNRSVIFDTGKFDDWCVYVVEANGSKQAPFDTTYFSDLYTISKSYPNNKVYIDFVTIYDLTNKNIDINVLNTIDLIVNTYSAQHKIIVEQWFTVLYAGMIAEENKQNAILKKRVKRLGMHQVLMLNMPSSVAAKFSYGKKWRDLDAIMRPYGF
jgi:hypothetical protein